MANNGTNQPVTSVPAIGSPAPSAPPTVDAETLQKLINERVQEEVSRRLAEAVSDGPDPTRTQVTQEDEQFSQFDKKLDVFGVNAEELFGKYHLHWFNDEGDRIMRMSLSGYTFVTRKEIALNDNVAPLNQDLGDNVAVYVGTKEGGAPLRAYLMKIPMETYVKRQMALQQRQDKVDEAIRRGAIGNALTNKGYAGTDGNTVPISVGQATTQVKTS